MRVTLSPRAIRGSRQREAEAIPLTEGRHHTAGDEQIWSCRFMVVGNWDYRWLPAALPRAWHCRPSAKFAPMNELAGKHIVLGLSGGVALLQGSRSLPPAHQGGATGAGGDDRGGRAVHHARSPCRRCRAARCTARSGMPASPTTCRTSPQPRADAIVIAPCSADFIARLVQRPGRRAAEPDVPGPAHRPCTPAAGARHEPRDVGAPATQRNLAQVAQDGATVLGVGNGDQACGETGDGRVLEPANCWKR